MPKVYILIGVPGSGKSTWVKQQKFDPRTTVVTGTDYHIDNYAEANGKTYTGAFKEYIKQASELMDEDIARAIKNNLNIVWDQTSLTQNCRAAKLMQIPSHYKKVAVAFRMPRPEVLKRRLESRPGKIIPAEVVERMRDHYELPSLDEGFDEIIIL